MNIPWKTIGKIALNTATTCAGLWAGGFWVGWGFKCGCQQAETIKELHEIRFRKERLDKLQKELNALKEKPAEEWTDQDSDKFVACYRELIGILGPNDPMVIELSETLLDIVDAEDEGEEVQK